MALDDGPQGLGASTVDSTFWSDQAKRHTEHMKVEDNCIRRYARISLLAIVAPELQPKVKPTRSSFPYVLHVQ